MKFKHQPQAIQQLCESSSSENQLEKEIRDEALRWVRNNQELKICEGSYSSPRISSEIPDCSMPMSFDHLKFCSFGCTYCVIPGTYISAEGGRKQIEALKVGDKVHSYNIEKKCLELDEVVNTMSRETNELLEITLENEATITITPEHPVYVAGKGWLEAKLLSPDDDVIFMKRPGASFQKTINNPMKNPVVVAKMAATLSAKYASGELDELKRATSKRTKKTHAEGRWHITPEGSKSISKNMTENNPQHNAEIAKKTGNTRHLQYLSGELKHPALGNKRPDLTARMSGPDNPMKDLTKRKKTLQKIVKSWIANGRISQGELRVADSLEFMEANFVHQYVVDGPSRVYSLDFFLPDEKICFEYDGHSRHYTESGIEKSKIRDQYILEHYGIQTVRIHRDEAFIGKEALANLMIKRAEA